MPPRSARFVVGVLTLLICVSFFASLVKAEEFITDLQIDTSVSKGITFLISQQDADGNFGGSGLYRAHPAVTALCGLALLADDHTLTRGAHAQELRNCVTALLAHAKPNGLIGDAELSPQVMYAHGYAITFLSEICGQENFQKKLQKNSREDYQENLREIIRRGVALIVQTQNAQGGWRYVPQRVLDADISVTATQLIALRSAKNAGFFVPSKTIADAANFIRSLQNEDGGFRYRVQEPESGFSRTAAALVALQAAGEYKSEKCTRGFGYLSTPPKIIEYETYGFFYAATAIYCGGGVIEESAKSLAESFEKLEWEHWYRRTARDFIARQNADGSWNSTTSREAETAMIIILLRLPQSRIPSLQR